MARDTNGTKVTDTVKRLLALEAGVRDLRGEVHGMRVDLNTGMANLLAGIERLHGAIDRVANVRADVAALTKRVTRLERRAR